jgi:predicted DNA-binding protein
MKTAISLPDDTLHRVDCAAKRLGISRSEFLRGAAERWLDRLEDDATTEAINHAIAGRPPEHASRMRLLRRWPLTPRPDRDNT